jgi:hypothetical protein
MGEYSVAAASFVMTSLVVLLLEREFIEWIITDLQQHKADSRGLFDHSHECILTEGHRHGK